MTHPSQPHPHAHAQPHAPVSAQPAPGMAPPAPRPMPAPSMPQPVPMPAPQQGGMPAPAPSPYGMPAPMPHAAPAQVPGVAPTHAPMPPAMPAPHYQGGPSMPAPAPAYGIPAPQAVTHSAMPAPSAPLPTVEMGPDSREEGERPLPQIAIHAFCDRQETAGCIHEMTRDWRMRRTNTKIYMGGLSAAIDYYHKEKTPALIIIESGMRGDELFNQLESLASVCDEGTKVVIIGAANDIRLYRQLMEKGVSDYLVPPLHPLNIIRSLTDLYADPDSPFTGRAVAFFGSKGGVGSSTLAHNIAYTLAERMMQETALIDLDSSWGTTALDFAYDSASGLEEALAEPDRLDDTLLDRIMVRHTERLSLLPASSSLNSKPVFDTEAYEMVVAAVRSVTPLALLDMPHIWADWTTNILTTVDDVVITTVPDLANLRNTKNLVDFLKAQRPNDGDPVLVLNQTGRCKSKDDEISVENFASAVGLEPALVIGFDPDTFSRACNEGKMLPEMKTTDALVPGLDYLANRLRTGRFSEPPAASAPRGRLGLIGKSSANDSGEGQKSKSLFASLLKQKG